MFSYFWPGQHHQLLIQFTRRDISQRYRGSWLGMGWSVLNPLMMLAVYTFVFQYVFQARWPQMELDTGDGVQYALNLFIGLVTFNWFSDIVNRAPVMIRHQQNLVKKVVFPLHLIAWSAVFSATFQAIIGFVIIILGVLTFAGQLPISLIALPLIFLLFIPLLLGISWGLSAIGTYLPDAQHLAAMITAPLMFLSPVFYPVSMLPEWAQELIFLNPLTLIIETLRALLLGSAWPPVHYLLLYMCGSIGIAILGAWLFHRLRSGFADVL